MIYYLHPDLQESWGSVLQQLSPNGWTNEWPKAWAGGDVAVLPDYSAEMARSCEPAKVFLLGPKEAEGPQFAALLEQLQPDLRGVDPDLLERGWQALLDGFDSPDDLDRLKRVSHAIWGQWRYVHDKSWIDLAKLAWTFERHTVRLPDGDYPLFVALGYQKWYQFSDEFLEVSANYASALKWAWEIYHVRLGWTPERMLEATKSKLITANRLLKTMMKDQEFRNDPRVKDILDLIEQGSFGALRDKVAAEKNGGHTISFKREDIEDLGLVKRWVKSSVAPDLLHSLVFYDGGPLTGEESSFVIILNPNIEAEEAALIKARFDRLLHWKPKDDRTDSDQDSGDGVDLDEL